jgi:hypothetical protein
VVATYFFQRIWRLKVVLAKNLEVVHPLASRPNASSILEENGCFESL